MAVRSASTDSAASGARSPGRAGPGGSAGVELVAVNDPMGDATRWPSSSSTTRSAARSPTRSRRTDNGFSVDGHEIPKLEVMDPARSRGATTASTS